MNNMDNTNKFLALTIGPVVKTLLEARKTRELWAASFLLSSLMRHLCNELDRNRENLLIPHIPQNSQTQTYGAGIYPDRLFMKAQHLTDGDVKHAIDRSLIALAKDCNNHKNGVKTGSVDFWRQFFRIRYVFGDINDISNGNLSKRLSPILDTMELEDVAFSDPPSENFMLTFFEEANFFNCPITNELRNQNRGSYDKILNQTAVFPSTIDIAAFELAEQDFLAFGKIRQTINDLNGNDKFFQLIENDNKYASLKKIFKQRHKYFCIVQADGDNIGKAIERLHNEHSYRTFSETLANYGLKAAGIINNYGGKPIYIGGDDLLFLAPVFSSQGSVFDLIEELNNLFPVDDLSEEASLSFGINIVYYKYPLFEAISETYGLLYKAKEFNHKNKNAVSFRLTKHSGAYFEGVFSKNFLHTFNNVCEQFSSSGSSGNLPMISSIIFKLNTLQSLLNNLLTNNQKEITTRIDNVFNAYFNEWGDQSAFLNQRDAAKSLLISSIQEPISEKFKLYYAAMRLIQFIVSPSDNNSVYDTENMAATAG